MAYIEKLIRFVQQGSEKVLKYRKFHRSSFWWATIARPSPQGLTDSQLSHHFQLNQKIIFCGEPFFLGKFAQPLYVDQIYLLNLQMSPLVIIEISQNRKTPATDCANIGSLSCMQALVDLQIVFLRKDLPTDFARETQEELIAIYQLVVLLCIIIIEVSLILVGIHKAYLILFNAVSIMRVYLLQCSSFYVKTLTTGINSKDPFLTVKMSWSILFVPQIFRCDESASGFSLGCTLMVSIDVDSQSLLP
ncbi:hypothetical protein FGO68_gene5894 [Halteria grandinella]|uniref:Uncharacterized protein n=1 Tax=Halteria grandinella TaxID=5974 RepID=A0A8J8T8J3_HALGN|nr:hypothetical protein FGO68_gene5894 [Halteria grandinella]